MLQRRYEGWLSVFMIGVCGGSSGRLRFPLCFFPCIYNVFEIPICDIKFGVSWELHHSITLLFFIHRIKL